jgi:hypothetical protein
MTFDFQIHYYKRQQSLEHLREISHIHLAITIYLTENKSPTITPFASPIL